MRRFLGLLHTTALAVAFGLCAPHADDARAAGISHIQTPRGARPASAPLPQSLTTETTKAAVLITFSNVKLLKGEPGENALEMTLRLSGPVDAKIVEGLDKALPDWIEYASSGYDSVLIRTKRKAVFGVEETANGFRLRLAWAPKGPEEPSLKLVRVRYLTEMAETAPARTLLGELRGSDLDRAVLLKAEADIYAAEKDPRAAFRLYDKAIELRPGDMSLPEARARLAFAYADHIGLSTLHQSVEGGDTQWRTVMTLRAAIDDQSRIETVLEHLRLSADAVVRTDGVLAPFDGPRTRLAAHYRFDYGGGELLSAAIFAAPDVLGLGASYAWASAAERWEIEANWHEPAWNLVEGIVNGGTRDSIAARYEVEHKKTWFANIALRLNRYGVKNDDDVAQSIAAEGGVSYRLPVAKTMALVFGYSLDAEYVDDVKTVIVAPATEIALLPLVDREVHSFSLAFAGSFDEQWSLDAAAGYAIDRFASGGIFANARLAYTPVDALTISANASYSAIGSRGGDGSVSNTGAVTTAGIDLLYTFSSPGALLGALTAP